MSVFSKYAKNILAVQTIDTFQSLVYRDPHNCCFNILKIHTKGFN